MNEREFNEKMEKGEIEEVKREEREEERKAEFEVEEELDSYVPQIEDLRTFRRHVASVPTDTPRNFLDQIRLYFSGTTYRIYWYIKDAWKKIYDSSGLAPATHAASHQNGGADEINVGGLSGDLADTQDAKAHAASHQNGGGDEISVAGLSGELADNQPPKAHKANHENGGSDEISVAGLSGVLADDQPTNLTHVKITGTVPVKCTAANTWEDWDLSGDIPAGAKFAEIVVYNGDGDNGNREPGIRKKGSSVEARIRACTVMTAWAATVVVVLDANRVIQRYVEGLVDNVEFSCTGYWT